MISWQLASGGGIIGSIAPTKPYGLPFMVNIPSLTPNLTYIVTLWESPSTSPTGTVRNATNVIATANTTILRADDYLETDITTGLVNNTSAYVNTSYAGWPYDVERVGAGTMFLQGAPGVTDPDYAQDITGGFHLVRTGDVFAPNEKFVVRFQPMIAPAVAGSVGIISSGAIVLTSTVFTSADLNMAKFIRGTSSFLNLTLPSLSSVSDYQFMYFYSVAGAHVSAIISCAGSDTIQMNNSVAQITLCQNEQLKIFKANNVWNIDSISDSVNLVGEIIYRYNPSINLTYGLNTVPADGSLLNRNTYWRLFQYLSNSGITPVSETTWAAATVKDLVTFNLNKGGWTLGTDGTNFRVPDLRDYFLRGTTASIGGGNGMYDTMVVHKHPTLTGSLPGAPNGKNPITANNGKYNGQLSDQSDLTDLPSNDPGAGNASTPIQRTGTETAPKHSRIPILIRI